MTSRLPLRPPTVYGAAHETARAEGHPGHRASRPSRGGGARRLAHAGHVEKTDCLRCAGVSKEPRARPRMLRAVLRFDRRSTRSAGGLRGVERAIWPRCGCATPLPCAHTYHRAGGGAKVRRPARGVSARRQFLRLGILPRCFAGPLVPDGARATVERLEFHLRSEEHTSELQSPF